MLNTVSNIVAFTIFAFILVIEYIFSNLADFPYGLVWLFTAAIYFTFIIYQVLSKYYEDKEIHKVKLLLNEILDVIYGIPLLNKNEKLVIKWDIVFKKLIDKNEYALYDKIVKESTKKIEQYINQYPSLLYNNNIDLKESKHRKIDLNSVVKVKDAADKNNELVDENEVKSKLYIKNISSAGATFTNFDSTILAEVVLNEENEPDEELRLLLKPLDVVDGFSVAMFFNNKKYVIVPKVSVINKKIDKEKWFYRNIEKLLETADFVIKGEKASAIAVNGKDLAGYTTDISPQEREKKLTFVFQALAGEFLIFKSINSETEIRVYCELDTGYNSFDLVLKKIEKTVDGKKEIMELQKTIAIGSSYQPLVTILEKMPFILNNIKTVIDNKDISDIVIK